MCRRMRYRGTRRPLPLNFMYRREEPFQTVQRAQEEVRKLTATMDRNIVVYLREGRYYFTEEWKFDQTDSGRNGCQVIYSGYEGETAELIGGTPVSGWEAVGGGIYKATLDHDIYALYENDERAYFARNEGYFRSRGGERESGNGALYLKYDEKDLPASADIKAENMFVSYWPGANFSSGYWYLTQVPVLEVNREERLMKLDGYDFHTVNRDSKYFMSNALYFLDEPGEFYFDYETRELYYMPIGENIEEQEIIAPCVEQVLNIQGVKTDMVQDLQFRNLKIGKTDYTNKYLWPSGDCMMQQETSGLAGVVYTNYCTRLAFTDCYINNAGMNGFMIHDYSTNVTIERCRIENIGYTGIYLLAFPPNKAKDSYVNYKHSVVNNQIHHVGQMIYHGAGIRLIQSGENVISHNDIRYSPRYGISIQGSFYEQEGSDGSVVYGLGKMLMGQEVTRENFKDFIHTRNNQITYNYLSDCMQGSEDGGVISTWGTGTGNVIDHNIMCNYGRDMDGVIGLYLDDESDQFTVTNNIVYGGQLTASLAAYIKGHSQVIRNNIFIANSGRVHSTMMFAKFLGMRNDNMDFQNNIVVQMNGESKVMDLYDWSNDKFKTINKNVYYNPNGKAQYKMSVSDSNLYDFAYWRQFGTGQMDADSVEADPMFTDMEGGDFTLQENSPASELGFVDIDTSEIGLTQELIWNE